MSLIPMVSSLCVLELGSGANAVCTDPRCVFRTKGVPVFENYMRLVMYSFGFESAWKRRGVEPGDMFFVKVRTGYMG